MKPCYRLLSATAILGYGFDETAFVKAAEQGIDLIAADAGSMDAGPYYLGSGKSYLEPIALKRDFSIMMREALKANAKVIVGNCGFAGGHEHMQAMLDVAKEVFDELGVSNLQVAVIESEISSHDLLDQMDYLEPLGAMPPLTKRAMEESVIVPQMGIDPLISALADGAQVIFAGRACDVAIFAADPVRCGIDPGVAYHAGHVLECGAIAADPGSGSDCLLAEFFEDGRVEFIAPSDQRVTTQKSIAAHSLYEESNPWVQHYPEGVLSFAETEYYQRDERVAGLRNTRFYHNDLSIKIEGSRSIGYRYIGLVSCDNALPVSNQYLIYGVNGVEPSKLDHGLTEIGIVIEVRGKDAVEVETLASLLKAGFLHFGYEGRRSTAGNMAYPLSPSSFSYSKNGQQVCVVAGGTRDSAFISQFEDIKAQVLDRIRSQNPSLYESADITVHKFDGEHRLVFVDTVAPTKHQCFVKHMETLSQLGPHLTDQMHHDAIESGDVYVWSVFHLLKNPAFIQDKLFTVEHFDVTGSHWHSTGQGDVTYEAIGEPLEGDLHQLDDIGEITAHDAPAKPEIYKHLTDMATVIRSKDAGINTITYDIFFSSEQDYRDALASNQFHPDAVAEFLGVDRESIVGCYAVENCLAIKVSRYRSLISAMPGDRDVFGAQQHSKLTTLDVPLYHR